MKSAVAALGLFAAMANASYHHPRHFHFRRDNTTTSADDAGLTTLTVIATQTSTVISCAPTVTNCPARPSDISSLPESDKATFIVTNTVILTETVCPISEAPAISSSILDQASTLTGTIITTSLTPSAPLGTGVGVTSSAALPEETGGGGIPGEGVPSESAPVGGEGETVVTTSTEVHEIISTKTLTITMGGTSTSVITTAIPTTVYSTVIVTCHGGCGGEGKPTKEVTDVSPEQTGTPNEPASEEPTTTTTSTRTATTTVTVPGATKTAVVPGESDNTETPGNDNGNGTPGQCDNQGVCQCPARETVTATATVTVPASTVYVTVSHATTAAAQPSSGAEEVPEDDEDVEDDEDDEDECPAEITTTKRATVTVPYPTGGNSTTSGVAAPTGLAHLRF